MERGSETARAEKLFKVLVIGHTCVGKSCIIKRYVNQQFKSSCKPTIGVDFALKTIEWDDKTMVRLQLWDIAGQERFTKMTRVYYKGAMGAMVVFDITKKSTLERAVEWKQDLDSKVCLEGGRPVPAVLLANKCDLTERDADMMSSLDSFCKDNNFLGWFETSAKDNINIDEVGAFLVKQMMLCDTNLANEDHHWDRIKVNQTPMERQSVCCKRPAF